MPRLFASILAIALHVGVISSQTSAAPIGVGALLWADEFNDANLDQSKWNIRLGAGRDDIYVSQAVALKNGALNLKTYTENGTHYNGWVDTLHKFQPTRGYFEARIQFNTSPGMWSAFWLQTPDWSNPVIGDPAASGTEIDVIEHRRVNGSGSDYRSRIHMAVHWNGYGPDHQSQSSTQIKAAAGMGNGSWHTYGLLWEADKYTFYFDGQETWSHKTAVSQRSEYLILSSEAQTNSWAGNIPAGGYGSFDSTVTDMQVDYVRAYSLVPEPRSVGLLLLAGLGATLLMRSSVTDA